MKNKGALILALGLVLVLGVSALVADTFWVGTFTGDVTGTWQGRLDDDTDPLTFSGSWTTHEDNGALDGDANEDHNIYYVENGRIYDADGAVIGHWSGAFNYNTSHARGDWYLVSGERGILSGDEVDE